MSKYNWHMKYNGSTRYWVIIEDVRFNDARFKDLGILETSYRIGEKEKREYILYDGHITLGHYETLRAAKQSFAMRQYRKEKNKNGN